jgi:hypothetical protein
MVRATERLVRGYVLVDGFFRGLWQISGLREGPDLEKVEVAH